MDEFSSMYLPRNLEETIQKSSRLNGRGFNKKKETVTKRLCSSESRESSDVWTPVAFFSLLLILTLFFSVGYKINGSIVKTFDFLLFATVGCLGCVLFYIISFAGHTVLTHNMNVVWANPIYLLYPFIYRKSRKILRILTGFNILILIFFIVFHSTLPQYFPSSLVPLWILLVLRLYSISSLKVG